MNSSPGPIFEPTARRDWSYLIPIALIIGVGIFGFFTYKQKDNRPLLVGAFPIPSQTPEVISIPVLFGDSYTTIARRAINTSGAAGLYAETVIAKTLKSQPLIVGSTVTISQQFITDTLASFSSLSPYQQRAWERLEQHRR